MVSKPRNLVSCVEHDSFKSPLPDLPYYQQEVVEILVARFLRLLTTDCKLTSLHGTSFKVLEDWTLKVEILAVSKSILHLKPWLHVVGPISPCFLLSEGMVFISCWSESFLFDHCLRIDLIALVRGPCFLYPDATLYRTRLLPHYEAIIWTFVFVAMDYVVSSLSIWRWWFTSQQSIFWKRCLVASELVENFPNCSANGTWIVSSALRAKDGMPQEAPHSTLSSGHSSLQILSDFIVPFFAMRTWLDLIEITVVVVYAMDVVPKFWCSSGTLF
ncbi:hypothetical protein Bca4012_049642 [Brassica carinata]